MFAGYDLPAEVAAAQKELAVDASVKKQLEAAKALDGIKKAFPTARTDLARKRVITRLEQLVAQFSETEAGNDAKELLEQAAKQP